MARGVGRATRNGGAGIVRVAKRDPVPLALVGVGLAWLITEGVRHRTNANGKLTHDEHLEHEEHSGRANPETIRVDRRAEKLRARAHAAVDRLGNTVRDKPLASAAAGVAGVAALGAITYAVMPHRR
jgi:hypothetical protein